MKPFVRVVRELSLDLDWTVRTTVERIAPVDGGFSVRVPLLAGEQPLDPALRIDDGSAEITLLPGSNAESFASRLARSETLVLTAPALADRAEVWRVVVGPSLSLKTSGVPISEPEDGIDDDDVWVHEFHPLPGETLKLTIARPVQSRRHRGRRRGESAQRHRHAQPHAYAESDPARDPGRQSRAEVARGWRTVEPQHRRPAAEPEAGGRCADAADRPARRWSA
ncbi:MAG: hypothetical protein IPO66_17945 [Rhodanobacteraceae bacterium]|nr:hypothetical protein [Rhodanobacteraceae bacterium]